MPTVYVVGVDGGRDEFRGDTIRYEWREGPDRLVVFDVDGPLLSNSTLAEYPIGTVLKVEREDDE